MSSYALQHGHPTSQSQSINIFDNAPPSPPQSHGVYGSPLRRNNVLPPSLTTSLATHTGSLQSTPLSAVSRSSPFTPLVASPGLGVVASASRSRSPMAPRPSAPIAVPYDPRDWASGDVRVNQNGRAREQQGEDGLTSPPPPYSPEAQSQESPQGASEPFTEDHMLPAQRAHNHLTSRCLADSSAPLNHDGTRGQSAHPPGARRTSNPVFVPLGYQVPPPPPMGPSSRQSSQVRMPTTEAPFNNVYESQIAFSPLSAHAPTARRAASASAGLQLPSEPGPSSRSVLQFEVGQGHVRLPGPPPGPPPAASRSQSASMSERSMHGSEGRYRSSRYSLQIANLGPIPPTPVGWADQPEPHQQDRQGPHSTVHVEEQDYHEPAASFVPPNRAGLTSSMGLSRSSAMRDSSAQGLRERRALHRNSRCLSNADMDPLLVSTGLHVTTTGACGTAPAVSQSKSRTPRGQNLSLDTSTPPSSPSSQLQVSGAGARHAAQTTRSLPTPPLSNGAVNPFRRTTSSRQNKNPEVLSGGLAQFQTAATERFNDFIEKEQFSSSDVERLELFGEYILREAALRAQSYRDVILSNSVDIQSIRDRLFQQAIENDTDRSIMQDDQGNRQPAAIDNVIRQRQETHHRKDYEPALSPIASMDYDEMSSRGRAPSRWWESQSGSQSGGKAPPIQRSKRESKYMGLSKELLTSFSPNSDTSAQAQQDIEQSSSAIAFPSEKANPETFGYYEEVTPRTSLGFHSKSVEGPALLDISRFVTLPPPYPRHFPAVNNNHPKLAQYRTTVRTLSNLDDIHSRKSRYKSSSEALRSDHKRRVSESRREFRANVQSQIQDGSISFTEAAEAEEIQKEGEFELEKSFLQSEFDTLQDMVINPLHDFLHDRISQLDSSIEQLKGNLRTDIHHQDPDGPQEEGDETPELLETLTQLKWLFDTREQMHKELYDILTDRNEKFKSVVLLPHRFHNKKDKIRETEAFFEQDSRARHIKHCEAVVQRHEALLTIMDACVARGVELQSSAFWDIAPGLLDVLQKIPEDLQELPGIQIPPDELTENPSYHQHPQQYLYLLLSHAEKSTYQYIEGQTNLQCLLHEVKSGLLLARHRLMQADEGDNTSVDRLERSRAAEDAALTTELKQKASMIEEQWLEALGSQLQGTRDRVRSLLEETDAWEEIAHDDA